MHTKPKTVWRNYTQRHARMQIDGNTKGLNTQIRCAVIQTHLGLSQILFGIILSTLFITRRDINIFILLNMTPFPRPYRPHNQYIISRGGFAWLLCVGEEVCLCRSHVLNANEFVLDAAPPTLGVGETS